ncbi:MAG: hypothetical protein mread185_000315 [Mycoplasmataceae bacterium]|nr:MAG: hypothetical protein mread185_000315 [Mycoplasmataceae bacterium]
MNANKIKQALDSVRIIHNKKTKKWYVIVNFLETNYCVEHTSNPWNDKNLMNLAKISIGNKIAMNLHQEANKWTDLRDRESGEESFADKEKDIEVKIWDS